MSEHLCSLPFLTLAEANAVITCLSAATDTMRQEPEPASVHVRLHAGQVECLVHRGKGLDPITIQHRVEG